MTGESADERPKLLVPQMEPTTPLPVAPIVPAAKALTNAASVDVRPAASEALPVTTVSARVAVILVASPQLRRPPPSVKGPTAQIPPPTVLTKVTV